MCHCIALIHNDPDTDYGVSFPDFPGCVTVGATLDEPREQAEEVLAFHVDGMAEDGDAIPEPSALDRIMADRENRDGVAVLVPLRGSSAESVSVDVSIPGDLLGRLDRFAAERGMDRSAFLALAARKAIEAA